MRKRTKKELRKVYSGVDAETAGLLAVKAFQEGIVTFYNMTKLAWLLRKKLEI